MNVKFTLIVSCVSLLIGACKQDGGSTTEEVVARPQTQTYDFSLSQSNIDAYLKYKRIEATDKRKRDRATRSLIVRNALAELIVQQDWATQSEAQTHIKDRRNQILINSYFDDYVETNVNDASIQAFYEKNRPLFADKKIKLVQIVKPSPPDTKERKLAVKQMRELVKTLQQGGDFAAAMKKYSQTKTTTKVEKLPWLRESDLDRVLFNTALRLKKGDVYGPIETSKGLVIIKLLDGPEMEHRDLKDVKQQVVNQFKYQLKLDETARLNKLAASRIERDQKQYK